MKRLFMFALCLALLFASAEAAVSVRMEETAALLGEDGSVVVPSGEYADIVPLGGERFAATLDGESYALMDERGDLLTPARYTEFRLHEGILTACRDGGWGMLGADGAELTSFDFDAILPTGAGDCWALRPGDGERSLVLLDALGRTRFTALRALRWGEPGEGLLPIQTEDGRWGYCDASGKLAIPARFDWAGGFAGGCALAVEGGSYGAIGADGSWIVAPEWPRLERSSSGLLLASGEAGVTVLTATGQVVAGYSGTDVWGALAGEGYMICDGEALRVFASDGTLREELGADAAVSEGLAGQLIYSEGMWGEDCVRLSGTDVRYQDLVPLGMAGDEPVYACLEVNAARYENDLLHEIQVSVDMDSARYGLVSGAGERLSTGSYVSVAYLCDDRFLVRDESQWLMIDSQGKIYWRSGAVERIEEPGV